MVTSKLAKKPICNLKTGNQCIKEVESFNYLGNVITTDARCKTKVSKQIAIAKMKFQDM